MATQVTNYLGGELLLVQVELGLYSMLCTFGLLTDLMSVTRIETSFTLFWMCFLQWQCKTGHRMVVARWAPDKSPH